MKIAKIILFAGIASLFWGCSSPAAQNMAAKPTVNATPVPTASVPVNGDYPGTGVITKINSQLGSIELDHNEIVGVMPAMKMEFFVSDKSLLDGLSVGEKVQFTVRYKDHTETIVDIKKPK